MIITVRQLGEQNTSGKKILIILSAMLWATIQLESTRRWSYMMLPASGVSSSKTESRYVMAFPCHLTWR
jgi:hypothetical protein